MNVASVVHILDVHPHDPAGDATSLRVPSHLIADFECPRHRILVGSLLIPHLPPIPRSTPLLAGACLFTPLLPARVADPRSRLGRRQVLRFARPTPERRRSEKSTKERLDHVPPLRRRSGGKRPAPTKETSAGGDRCPRRPPRLTQAGDLFLRACEPEHVKAPIPRPLSDDRRIDLNDGPSSKLDHSHCKAPP